MLLFFPFPFLFFLPIPASSARDSYLNRPDVQHALHVKEGTLWEQCSTQVQYKTTDMLRPMMPYCQRLLKDHDIAVLVFSGVSEVARTQLGRFLRSCVDFFCRARSL